MKMTVGEMLHILSSYAGDYYKESIALIKRNRHMNNLTEEDVQVNEAALQRIGEAVVVDFINYIGAQCGVDYAMYTKDLAEEFQKNKKARAEKQKDNTGAEEKKIKMIVKATAHKFRSFGGGVTTPGNPLAETFKDYPPLFAAGVNIEEVVRFVLSRAEV